ncbi:MAG TPA: primosomal protein N' [Sedimenticola sp.]|nr:primosomal protein N' [Sedimenticola sp.]
MPDRSQILRIAIPAPLRSLFDYLPPPGIRPEQLVPGKRLLVPFGRGQRCGILISVAPDSELPRNRLKAAVALLDDEPLFTPLDLELLQWAARYYRYPPGEVISGALPVRLRDGQPLAAVKPLGWRLTELAGGLDAAALARAPRQAAMLEFLRERPDGASRAEIRIAFGSCSKVLQSMEQKGWVVTCELEEKTGTGGAPVAGPVQNSGQRAAVEAVTSRLQGFGPFLLDGVTGSGKTEVYLCLIEKVLASGRQVLVLVPEIGLTPQLLRRLGRRLGAPMAVLHSGLPALERERGWNQARCGHARLVLGTRSAIFTPMPQLGLIVVDEEHDLSYKQQEGFRYSARDLALVRARLQDCPVVLGSATPSLESLHNASTGRYRHLLLPQRAGGASPPAIDLLDVRSVRLESGVSPTLMRMLGEELAAGNQVLLFLNRRGYAPVLTCHDCGWVAQCTRCDARMTLHLEKRLLWCHHCGSQRPLDDRCPECGGTELRSLGQGTERLEATLARRFPGVGIVRIDRDTTSRRGSLERLLREIRDGKHSLLLGTQMLSKGHHFPDVTLVGILDVDQGLFGADYRASERMAQQIVQVAGRAGRADKPGRVIIQTRHPEHPLLRLLLREGYGAFARAALEERCETHLPPYSSQALLRAESPREEAPAAFLEEAAALAYRQGGRGVELWGPVPAPMERRAGRYRAHLLLQADRRSELQALLELWLPGVEALKSARRVRWSLDVDPQEML